MSANTLNEKAHFEIHIFMSFLAPTAPPNVYHTCDIKVIVWDKPLLPNGNISRYDIEISFGNGSNITVVEHKGQNSYYLSDILFYPPELYEVKVKITIYYYSYVQTATCVISNSYMDHWLFLG